MFPFLKAALLIKMEVRHCREACAWLLLHHHDRVPYTARENIQVVIERRLVMRLSDARLVDVMSTHSRASLLGIAVK